MNMPKPEKTWVIAEINGVCNWKKNFTYRYGKLNRCDKRAIWKPFLGRKITNTCWPAAEKKKIHQLGDLLKLILNFETNLCVLASTIYDSCLSTIPNLFQRVKIKSVKKMYAQNCLSRKSNKFFFFKMSKSKVDRQ